MDQHDSWPDVAGARNNRLVICQPHLLQCRLPCHPRLGQCVIDHGECLQRAPHPRIDRHVLAESNDFGGGNAVPHGGLNVSRQLALGATERRHYGDGGDLPARNMVNMRDLNLASVDLNLLPACCVDVMSRALRRMWVSVSLDESCACSARLRQVLGDDLLVRGPSGLALTSGAKEIAPRVAAVLNAARAIYRPPPFEPSKVRRVLHIGGCDTHSIPFVPDLINRIRAEAPGIGLSIQNYIRDIFKRLGPARPGRAAISAR
jgi:hypothetical protein